MKTRLLSALALFSLIVLGAASPATAGKRPIPGIKKTPEYRTMNRYVNFLGTKKSVPATKNRKTTYRVKLKAKRTDANGKAKALYTRRITRIKARDDVKERRAIRKIRHDQKVRVTRLNASLNLRLGRLNARQNIGVARIYSRYSGRINPLVTKRDRFQAKLAKAKSPKKRAVLTTKINSLQVKINRLADARQQDVNAVVARYDGRAQTLKDLFAGRINSVRKAARHEIRQAQRAYKRLYRDDIRSTKQRRTGELGLITGLAARGTGYINQMPPIG